MLPHCPPVPRAPAHHLSLSLSAVAFDRASSLTFLQLNRSLLPAAKPSSWRSLSSCPCAHVTHSVPNALCLPHHAPGNFLVTLSDHSKETSVLLKHLFTPHKTYHSNVIASLFVILPIGLQISRRKDLSFSFPAASDTAAKHGSQ